MSGLCLAADLAGAPAERGWIEPMVAASAERGRDGARLRLAGAAAAAAVELLTSPETRAGELPLVADGGRLVMVADCRLDNREELMAPLRSAGLVSDPRPSDGQLLLAAYRLWGADCPRRLLGDFAFALWDDRERRLLCARDPLGVRPLHYAVDGSRLIAASGVGAVVAGLARSPALDRDFLRRFLAGEHEHWLSTTAYRGVLRLPPAHLLTADPSGIRVERYFRFGGQPRRYGRPEAYVEELRELLQTAVRARLRAPGPVAVLASGGLDSSSIACAAHRLQGAGESLPPVRLYTCTFERRRAADERFYQQALWQRCAGFEVTALPSDDGWGLRRFGRDGGFRLSEPEISVDRFVWLRPLERARADGCRVVLSGVGGDQVFGGDSYGVPYNLLDVGWPELAGELPHFRRRSGRSAAWLLAYRLLRPRLGAGARRVLGHFDRQRDALVPRTPGRPASRLGGREPLTAAAAVSRGLLTGGLFAGNLLALDRVAAHAGVELRLPLLDRRLVDFFLSLPADCLRQNGEEKVLLRRAMRGWLPEPVRTRPGYAHFGELVEAGLRRRERTRVERLLDGSRVVALGLVDERLLRRRWMCYLENRNSNRYRFRGLVRWLCLEAWLRSLEEPSPVSVASTGQRESAA